MRNNLTPLARFLRWLLLPLIRVTVTTLEAQRDNAIVARGNIERQLEVERARVEGLLGVKDEEILHLKQTVDWICVSVGKMPMFGVGPKIERQDTPEVEGVARGRTGRQIRDEALARFVQQASLMEDEESRGGFAQ